MKFLSRAFKWSLVLSLGAIAYSCNNKNNDTSSTDNNNNNSQIDFEIALYNQAYNNGDHATAVMAINRILLLDSTQTQYYDSVSRHYIALGNANSAAYYAEKAIALNPKDEKMLEIAGYVYFESGNFRKAEDKFVSLYELTKDVKYIHQLSQIYAYMGDIKRANEMTDKIISDSSADNVFVETSTSTGGIQQVKIKAAAYFVKANLVESNKQILSYLNKALAIQPDYEIVAKIKEDIQIQAKMKEIQENEALLEKYRNK